MEQSHCFLSSPLLQHQEDCPQDLPPMSNHLPREESEEQQSSQTWDCKSFQDHQWKVRNVVAQWAIRWSAGEMRKAFEVRFISWCDFSFIGSIVDDIGNEEWINHEEDAHKQQHPRIWNDHWCHFSQFDGKDDQFDEGDCEEDQSQDKKDSHWNEEECQWPCIVVFWCDETTIGSKGWGGGRLEIDEEEKDSLTMLLQERIPFSQQK